jgi:hypothetical protein
MLLAVLPELELGCPVITLALVLVPVAILPAVPLGPVADSTGKVVPPCLMVISAKLALFALPPVPIEKAEMLQDPSKQGAASEFVIKPVARKLPPA